MGAPKVLLTRNSTLFIKNLQLDFSSSFLLATWNLHYSLSATVSSRLWKSLPSKTSPTNFLVNVYMKSWDLYWCNHWAQNIPDVNSVWGIVYLLFVCTSNNNRCFVASAGVGLFTINDVQLISLCTQSSLFMVGRKSVEMKMIFISVDM